MISLNSYLKLADKRNKQADIQASLWINVSTTYLEVITVEVNPTLHSV